MTDSPNNKENFIKNKINLTADWIVTHTRIVMPIILAMCVLVTIMIALNANERTKLEGKTESLNNTEETNPKTEGAEPGNIPLEENQYPEVNELINNYYKALADGDIETAAAINKDLDDLAKIRVAEMAKYIDYYDKVDVYTKTGLTEGSYVAYVCAEVRFKDVDKLIPGFQTFYVMRDGENKLVIRKNDLDDNIYEYIKAVTLQDDVVDLNNKITVEYNDLLASDKELEEFIAYMTIKINEDVGVVLAQNEQPDITPDSVKEETNVSAGQEDVGEHPAVTTVRKAKAKAVVNIRSSDSETADKLDKAMEGQEFTVLEQKGNGWSRIKYNDKDAYIKSDYLEIIEEVPSDSAPSPAAQNTSSESASQASAGGTVIAKDSIRVRSTASTEGDNILATVFKGEKLEFVEKMSNGWTKVKYKNKIGYVKSEYVE